MSFSYVLRGAPATGASLKSSGITPAGIFGNNKDARSYTSYKKMGGKREGISSVLDNNIIQAEVDRQEKVWGEGYVRLAMLDDNGRAVTNRPLNLDGKVHYCDEDGTFTIVDGKLLKDAAELENERNEQIRKIVEYAGMSDQTLAMTLGVDVATMHNQLGAGKNVWGKITQQELIDCDATPEAMGLVDKSSVAYARASQKLRIAIKHRKPIVSFDMTSESAKNAETAQ